MADAVDVKVEEAKADAAAEKAYAAAAEQTAPVAVKAAPKKKAAAPKTAAKPVAKVDAEVAAVVAAKTKPATKAAAKKAPVKKAAAKKVAPKKAAAPKTVKPVPAIKAAKTAKVSKAVQLKDKIMTKTTTAAEDFTGKFKAAVADAQDRAKAAYEKGTALASEAGEFNKGNLEALVEAGKIFSAGLQELARDYAAEGKSAFETMTADVKELAAVKSPTDFFKLQGEILRRNFDAAVATGSKNSEAVLKLANDSFAPISSRISIAVEKVKKAA